MKNTEDKLGRIINKLNEAKPTLDQPEDLTEQIMASVAGKRTSRAEKVILFIRPWVSIAAVFLIGLYIFQQNDIPASEQPKRLPKKKSMQISTNNCLATFLNGEDRGFLESYFCYVKQTELKNKSSEQLILKLKQKL